MNRGEPVTSKTLRLRADVPVLLACWWVLLSWPGVTFGQVATVTPPNDLFGNAQTLVGSSGTENSVNTGAGKETGEPNHAGNAGGHSVWYRWLPTVSGTVTFNTAGSSFDTLLAVYTGTSVGGLTLVAQNDDFPPDLSSAVTFQAVAGTTYRIAVDGYGGVTGGFTLRWLYPQVTDSIFDHENTNYTAFVIDADALNPAPAYNREAVHTHAIVYSVNNSPAGHPTTHRLSYRLLGPGDQPHPVYDSTGVTNADYTYNLTSTFAIGANATVTNAYVAALRPAARLNPYVPYRVELKVFRGSSLSAGPFEASSAAYYHFTNTISSDTTFNVIGLAGGAFWDRISAVKTVAGKTYFTATVNFYLLRYDNFTNAVNSLATIPVRLNYELRDAATDAVIPLTASQLDTSENVLSYEPGSNPLAPRVHLASRTVAIEPAASEQLDAVNRLYKLRVTIGYGNAPAQALLTGNTTQSGDQRLLHFNGHLFFGSMDTVFTSIANQPGIGTITPVVVHSDLAVDNNSGFVVGKPNHVYGDGTVLAVVLRSNGNAELRSGSVTLALNPPGSDLDTNANVRFVRGPITLSPSGGVADFTVYLPAGLGFTTDITQRYLLGGGTFPAQPLSQNLTPSGNPVFPIPIWICEETKPLWIEVSSSTWVVNAGQFVLVPTGQSKYVRADELEDLEAAPVPTEQKIKRSNEVLYRYVTEARGHPAYLGAPIVVKVNNRSGAEMDFKLIFGGGRVYPHMPYAALSTATSGQMLVTNDLVDVAASYLDVAPVVRVPYNRDCFMLACAAAQIGPKTNELTVPGRLNFTLDGGLGATGTLAIASPVQLGYLQGSQFAHETDPFGAASFLMPGTFLRGDQIPALLKLLFHELEPTNGAGVLLLTGFNPNNLAQSERPWDFAYMDPINGGQADYAGLNFRVPPSPVLHGRSVLGGQPTGNYDLTSRSKYYTRWGGVSGIHEAMPGSFSSMLTIYGYHMNFGNFGLSFLDSQNKESAIQGYVDIPFPSDITNNFEGLKFNCVGDLTDAKVPPSEAGKYKLLSYWNADFVTLAIKFDRDPNALCPPGKGFLVLGVKAHATHVEDPLYGFLGIHTNGNLLTAADSFPGKPPDLNSRLKTPATFMFAGPPGESYTIAPTTEGYFNNWDYYKPPGAKGFLNFAGRLDVTFFEDIEVHAQTGGKTNEAPEAVSTPANLMGGWASDSSQMNHGWTKGGQHFFSHTGFDADNVGFPAAGAGFDQTISLSSYRNYSNEDFHPRARQNWLDVVPFDYPLTWLDVGRSFRSFEPVVNFDLLVLKADHQLKYLSAENAELVFGAQYKGFPQMNLANMLFKEVDSAAGDVLGSAGAFKGAGLTNEYNAIVKGLKGLDRALDDKPGTLFDSVLDQQLSNRITALYVALSNNFNANTKAWVIDPALLVHDYFFGGGSGVSQQNSFKGRLNDMVHSIAQPALLTELDTTLGDASNAVVNLKSLFSGTGGNREKAVMLASALVADFQGTLGGLAQSALNAYTESKFKKSLEGSAATLDAMLEGFDDYGTTAGGLRTRLQSSGDWRAELKSLVNDSALDAFLLPAEDDAKKFVSSLNVKADNPFKHLKQSDFEAAIRMKIEDRFFASQLMAGLQASFRQRLYDFNSGLRQAADTSFGQLNQILRDTLNEALATIDNGVVSGLGSLAKVLATGGVNGYAHINGDALKELRLDAESHFKLTPVNELAGRVYFLFREYDSEDSSATCPGLAVAAKVAEVAMGAEGVKISWLFGEVEVSVGTRFTFEHISQTTFPRLSPINMAGKFDLKNTCVKLESLGIQNVGLVFAVGEFESYIGGKVSEIQFQGYKGSGGIFFGHIACSLDPLKSFDEHVGNNIGAPPFTGLYLYGEVWVPVIDLGCPLRASAGVGAGVFYFVEGPTYGGTMKLGIDGKILCFLGASGSVKLTGIKNPDGLQLLGTGKLCGEIDLKIKTIKKCKTADMTYKNGEFDVDF